jgi:hypothetical protein
MEIFNQKEKNVIETSKISFIFIFLFLLSLLGKLNAQEPFPDHHLLLNEIVDDDNEKSRIKILDKIILNFDWVNNLKDPLFIENSFKYKCNMSELNSVLNRINFDLIENQTEINDLNKWDKKKLGKNFKFYSKPSKKNLTHQYSIPIVQNKVAFIRIKSFQYNLEVSDYIFILEKSEERWEEICILVLFEVFI